MRLLVSLVHTKFFEMVDTSIYPKLNQSIDIILPSRELVEPFYLRYVLYNSNYWIASVFDIFNLFNFLALEITFLFQAPYPEV